MSCVLRICGESLDVQALLAGHPIPTDRTWTKGDTRTVLGKLHTNSGVQLLASDADLDEFARQIEDATAFLGTHLADISDMASFPGVQDAVLDFGISLPKGYVAQFSYVPSKLVQLVAKAGLGICLSHYSCSDGDGDEG